METSTIIVGVPIGLFAIVRFLSSQIRGHVGLLTQKENILIKAEFSSQYLVWHTNIGATSVFNVFFHLSFEDINFHNYWFSPIYSYLLSILTQFSSLHNFYSRKYKRALKVSKNGSFFFERSFISEIFKFLLKN